MIERVKRGVYSLSKVARRVEEGDVRLAVKASTHQVDALPPCMPRKQVDGGEGDWWSFAQVDDPVLDPSFEAASKRAKVDFVFGVSGEQVDGERMKGVSPMDSMERSSSHDVRMVSVPPEMQGPAETLVAGEVEENIGGTTQSPQELLDGLREQYLQALYISKVWHPSCSRLLTLTL